MKKIIYISTLFIVFISCKDSIITPAERTNTDEIKVTEAQFQAMNMELGQLQEEHFDVSIKTTGKIDVPPQNRAKITTFVGGYVKSTKLLVGDKVTKGQALLQLESTEFIDIQKEYLEAVEQMTYLKSEYERQLTLYNEKITSQKNYLKAESEYKRNKAIYQSLRSKLALLHIDPKRVEKGVFTSVITLYSPIAGDIVVMNANVGMFAAPSDVILEIVETSHLHLELNVFEKDLGKISVGQEVDFVLTNQSNKSIRGKIFGINKSFSNESKTVAVHAKINPSFSKDLISGMYVAANINITNAPSNPAANVSINPAFSTIEI